MQENLAKLKALKEDDKTEAAMLRSRIDEQSRLIMILKQRADEEIIRAQTLDRINKELTDFRENADHMLKNEIRKSTLLENRFHSLASNHEEMIKIKDEYKRVNQELREENTRLKNENARLFSKAIQEKDTRILELEKKFAVLKQENTNMEAKVRFVLCVKVLEFVFLRINISLPNTKKIKTVIIRLPELFCSFDAMLNL